MYQHLSASVTIAFLSFTLATFSLAISSVPASAFELFGVRLWGSEEDPQETSNLIDPKTYTVIFNASAPEEVETGLKSASQLWLGREDPVAGNAGLLARAKGDYRRLLAALYNDGYYGGSISIQISGREASDIGPGDPLVENPSITVSVTAGPLYTFGATNVENSPGAVPGRKPIETDFVSGLPAKAGAVRAERRVVIADWRLLGHAKARIENQSVTANHETRQLDVSIVVDPGPKTAFGSVTLEGAERVDEAFILRQANLKRGAPFDPKEIERAEKRLARLDLFSTQRFEEADALNVDGTLPLTLTVKERPRQRVGAGATISNVDGAGIEAFWQHRNLFGRAERLRIGGEISGLGQTTDIRELDYTFGANFVRPGVFRPDLDFTADLTAKREFNDTFEETSIEAAAGFTYLRSDALTLSAGAQVQLGEFEDAFGTRDLLTFGLLGSAIYDQRDDKLEPTKGFYLEFDANPFYEFEFGNPGARLDLEGRTYVTFDEEDRFTLAGRARIGSLIGPPRNETASDLLFFTGGGGSVRGFGFKTIGVTEADGSVTGGRSFVEGSLEARFRATDSFGGVLFADAGAVSENSFFDFNDGPSVGVGAGIRYYTSIGAIRVDVGVPVLNDGPDDPPIAIYAGIGQTF